MSKREQPSQPTGTNGFGPRRRSTVRFALSTGIGLALVAVLYLSQPEWFSASSLPGHAEVPKPTTVARPQPTATPMPKPKPSDPYIDGWHASPDNVKITLLGVHYTPGDNGRLANRGNVFAIVTLRVQNLQGKDYAFSPNVNCQLQTGCNFYVQDDQGEKNPPIPYDPLHTALRAVVLQPSGLQEGSYTFEVPKRDENSDKLVLLWYPSPFLAPDTLYHWILTGDPHHGR